MIATVFVN